MPTQTPTVDLTIPGSALGPQVFVGARPDPSRFEPPRLLHPIHGRNRINGKPFGGLWTSTLCDGPSSDWIRWCQQESFDNVDAQDWWALAPNPRAVILAIDSDADLRRILGAYPHRPYAEMSNRLDLLVEPHFERLAADGIAALHLTEEGQATTRFSFPHNLYGWDCETTLWLRWAFVGEPELIHEGMSDADR